MLNTVTSTVIPLSHGQHADHNVKSGTLLPCTIWSGMSKVVCGPFVKSPVARYTTVAETSELLCVGLCEPNDYECKVL